jgi:hypothetical protein
MTPVEWDDFLASHPGERRNPKSVADLHGAIAAWSEAVDLLGDAPLFPVRTFADTVALYAADLHDDPSWSSLVIRLDSNVADAAGRHAAAALARSRSLTLQTAGRPFAALSELHQARVALVRGDSRDEGAEALLDAADLYRQLGLLYAAKYYALAAGAVSSMEDEQQHPYIAASLVLAAQCDFVAGNWFSFMAELAQACTNHLELREAAHEFREWPDFVRLLQSVAMVASAVKQAANTTLSRWFQSRLSAAGIDPAALTETDVQGTHSDEDGRDVISFVRSQLGQAPFADTGSNRVIRFVVRGVRWRIRSRNTFDDVRAAERLAAAVQTIVAALGDEDLVLAETTIEVHVKTAPPRQGAKTVKQTPKWAGYSSDGAHRWKVILTRDLGPHSVEFVAATGEVVGVTTTLLRSVSLLPDQAFASALDRVGGESLVNAVFPHIRYDRAYAVLPREEFAERDRRLLQPLSSEGFGEVLTSEHLAPLRTPGPVLRGETPTERAANRYPVYAQILRITVPRLSADGRIRGIIERLRGEGWKDWHILMAISNLVINFRLMQSGEDFQDPAVRDRIVRWAPEEPSDVQVDPSLITTESLWEHLMASVRATADAYGLEPGPLTPAEVLNVLATRYSYWIDDADHEDPFRIDD